MKDTIVDEVRRIRREIEKEYAQDPAEYLEHIYSAQKEHGDKLVHRQPKPLKKRKVLWQQRSR